MVSVELHHENDEKLIISFKYYKDYIDRIKTLGGKFDPDNRVWVLDKHMINDLDALFSGELYYKTPKWELMNIDPPQYDKMYKINRNIDISELNFKLQPFKYQEYGIKFLIDRLYTHSMAFICDGMGLGKTLQAIGTIEYFLRNEDIDTVLVVCKKSLKYQWEEEFYKFIDPIADIFVIPDSKNKRYKLYDEIKKTNNNKKIIITNYHTVLNDSKELSADMIVYDECHTAKNHKGKINKACRDITKKAQLCLFMTGTPVMSKPLDIYGIVSIKDNKYFSNSYSAFHKEYITMSYDSKFPVEVGYKNIDKLRDKIQTLILRRTSNEVDIDMPDVIEHNVFLDMDNYQEELYSVVKLEVEKHKGRINDILEKLEDDKNNKNLIEMKNKYESVLKGYIAIEQVIANNPRVIAFSKSKSIRERYSKYIPGAQYHSPKYIKFLDIVEESVESGEKVIVFSKYETVVSHLADFLNNNKIKTVICHGGLNGEERNDVIRSFKFDDSVKVIIATDALAEGI